MFSSALISVSCIQISSRFRHLTMNDLPLYPANSHWSLWRQTAPHQMPSPEHILYLSKHARGTDKSAWENKKQNTTKRQAQMVKPYLQKQCTITTTSRRFTQLLRENFFFDESKYSPNHCCNLHCLPLVLQVSTEQVHTHSKCFRRLTCFPFPQSGRRFVCRLHSLHSAHTVEPWTTALMDAQDITD